VRTGWLALAGPKDAVIGVDRFGVSGPGRQVAEHLGLSVPAVQRVVRTVLGREPDGRKPDA
jgi:transketolase